jgi:hypothetical protein
VLSLLAETGTVAPGDLRAALHQTIAGFRERSGCCGA